MASSIWRSSTFTVFIEDGGERILTTVTVSGEEVEYWLDEILDIHRCSLRRLVVGLDAEWRPNSIKGQDDNPVAVLQLCVGRRCLLFQIIHADYIPEDLNDFLSDDRFTFVGVGIEGDAKKLEKYKLKVSNTADLRQLAVEKMERPDLCNFGLKRLAREVMGIDIPKPELVAWSDWSNPRLTDDQITYAAVDGFISFEVGRRLIAGNAAVAEGTPLRMPRFPSCGSDTGWLLFFIGFFLAGIPWYVGAFILICVKTDYREKPGFIACTIAAVLLTAIMLGVTKGADAS